MTLSHAPLPNEDAFEHMARLFLSEENAATQHAVYARMSALPHTRAHVDGVYSDAPFSDDQKEVARQEISLMAIEFLLDEHPGWYEKWCRMPAEEQMPAFQEGMLGMIHEFENRITEKTAAEHSHLNGNGNGNGNGKRYTDDHRPASRHCSRTESRHCGGNGRTQ